MPRGVAVDSHNNITLVGYDNATGSYEWRIIKLGYDGVSLWNYTENFSDDDDYATSVAVDQEDNAMIVGFVHASQSEHQYEWRVMKFSPVQQPFSLWEEWWFWAAIAVVAVVLASGGYLLTKKKRPQ